MAGYVFISYSRHDEAYVESLVAYLSGEGIEVWADHKIHKGDNFIRLLNEKVDGCAAFVVVMTQHAKDSDWVQREIAQADAEGKKILPLLLDGQPLFQVRNLDYEDVRGATMPSTAFVAALRSSIDGATPAPRNWLPFVRSDGPQLIFDVVDGHVCSSIDESKWTQWYTLGSNVSRLVATQDGSYLVAQSTDAIVVGRVDEAGHVKALPAVPAGREDIRLIAARHRPARSFTGYSAVEVLVTTASASNVWVIDDSGLEDGNRVLARTLRAGAGTADGFLVITADGQLAKVSSASGEPTVLTDLGDGWLDVDAASAGSDGTTFAALCRVGEAMTASQAAVIDHLTASPRSAAGDVDAVRVSRQLGDRRADAGSADPSADVWLVSAGAHVTLASQPPAVSPATGAPSSAPNQWDVFLSYSSTFTPVAHDVRQLLEARGMKVWFAPNLHVGSWMNQVFEGIEESRSYVVLWGPGSDRQLYETTNPEKPPFMQLSEIEHLLDKARLYFREVHVLLLKDHPAVPVALSQRYQLLDERNLGRAEFADQVCEAVARWSESRRRDAAALGTTGAAKAGRASA